MPLSAKIKLNIERDKPMTTEGFKEKCIQGGLLTWEIIEDFDFDYMYNRLHFIDSTLTELFEVPMEMIIKKRKDVSSYLVFLYEESIGHVF